MLGINSKLYDNRGFLTILAFVTIVVACLLVYPLLGPVALSLIELNVSKLPRL